MTIDEAVALYRKGRIAAFTFDPDSIDMSYVERDTAEFRKGWVACVLNYDDASKDRIAQLESEIAELRKDRARLDGMIKHHLVCERTLPGWYRVSKLHEDGYAVERESAPTPREAIDAAIAAAKSKGEE